MSARMKVWKHLIMGSKAHLRPSEDTLEMAFLNKPSPVLHFIKSQFTKIIVSIHFFFFFNHQVFNKLSRPSKDTDEISKRDYISLGWMEKKQLPTENSELTLYSTFKCSKAKNDPLYFFKSVRKSFMETGLFMLLVALMRIWEESIHPIKVGPTFAKDFTTESWKLCQNSCFWQIYFKK